MKNPASLARRHFLKTGALVVGFSLLGLDRVLADDATAFTPHTLKPDELDAFIAVQRDGRVTIYSGKVDLGTGHRIAMRQIVAEELSIPVGRIDLIEGDTARTPDQGPTAGSTGIMRGGMQLRQAAATARQALIAQAATRLQTSADRLALEEGVVRSLDGNQLGFAELIGGRGFGIKLDPNAPLKDPGRYTVVGQPLPRPDIPAKVTGRHVYVHDFQLPGMLHGRPIRPPAVGASLVGYDEASIAHIPGVRVIRIGSFLGVLAPDEWAAVRAARELKTRWDGGGSLVGDTGVRDWALRGPFANHETLANRGDTSTLSGRRGLIKASYFWPIQSHASIGPSCAVADVQRDRATIWTASQATHRYWPAFARMLDLPADKVRLIYLDGAGCYGMNGHDDAAADAALLSKAVGQPVRVQWMREDELGWDPKGPPQVLEMRGALDAGGHIDAWEAQMWVPLATAKLPHVPLLAPGDAGIAQPTGRSVGLVSQNAEPPYRCPNLKVTAHWIDDAPLRPSNIRAPGKVGNCFAVESFVDELAWAAKVDPLEFRMRDLDDPRGVAVLKRCAALIGWRTRADRKTAVQKNDPVARGVGLAYVHYKQNETYVAIAMEVAVDRQSGAIHVQRVACAHDCGQMINPNTVRAQVEGNILQTLSRTLYEKVSFDRARVTSVDWSSYTLLRFPDVPELLIDLVPHPDLPPLGAGEAAATPVPGALANAVFDACGVRLREAPFTPDKVLAGLRKA